MKAAEMETRMRRLEMFHSLRVPDGAYPIIRVDGRAFHSLTAHLGKPFDLKLHEAMLAASERLLQGLQGVYAYAQSDEISLLLPRSTELFDRSVEKYISVAASIASAELCSRVVFDDLPQFDGRTVVCVSEEQVLDYFSWRQADAYRNCVSSWAFHSLRNTGHSARNAHSFLVRKSQRANQEMLRAEFGINVDGLPLWQRRGAGVYWKTVQKTGWNPKTRENVEVARRKLFLDEQLPVGEDYRAYLRRLLCRKR